MKKTLLVALFGICGFAGTAIASPFVLIPDPSGSPMCFTASGEKAPLAKCADQRVYVKAYDPSGGAMCFNEYGAKAPLASCASAPEPLLASR